jgi:hypothetical protein
MVCIFIKNKIFVLIQFEKYKIIIVIPYIIYPGEMLHLDTKRLPLMKNKPKQNTQEYLFLILLVFSRELYAALTLRNPKLAQHRFDKMMCQSNARIPLNAFIPLTDVNIKEQVNIYWLKRVVTIVSIRNSPNQSAYKRMSKPKE